MEKREFRILCSSDEVVEKVVLGMDEMGFYRIRDMTDFAPDCHIRANIRCENAGELLDQMFAKFGKMLSGISAKPFGCCEASKGQNPTSLPRCTST